MTLSAACFFALTHASIAAAASASTPAGAQAPASLAASQTGAREAGLVAAVGARLAEKPAVRARFRETQTLAALKSPLVSTGTLLFVRERGVIWRIDTPYAAAYVIGDAGVARIGANGERAAQAGRPPAGVAQVSRMMRAMLGGDLSALYAQFDVRAAGTPAQWRIELTPNQPQLVQAIDSLQMEGGEFLRSLVIRSASGDITRIDFVDSAVVSAPAAADLALFGAR
ncbi:hypothetical protein C9I57_11705 [Trinickia symbiotica]|uniref:Outer membrane lipoprotein carrier protein LolA n=2 Tax=Trinickia symbiotica TaxID=863227 RepID=A0A2T3XW50_9BURK|nr:hypothetical protein C9I57_11705 [Trinickia symbiotica]